MTSHRILVVDDEPDIREILARALRRGSQDEVVVAADGQAALEVLGGSGFDAIVSDHRMPGILGIDLLERAAQAAPDAVRVLMTGYADLQLVERGLNEARISRVLQKPFTVEEVVACVRELLAERDARRAREAAFGRASSLRP